MQNITISQEGSPINAIKDKVVQSWSYSKHKRFLNCKRGLVFTDVIAPLGMRKDSTSFERKVTQLNQMKNLDMLFGISIHNQVYQAVKEWFREGIQPDAERIYKNIRCELNQAFIDSKSYREVWKQGNGVQGAMLQEIYYSNELPADRAEKIREKMVACTNSFCSSSTLEEIMYGEEVQFDHAERNRSMNIDNVQVKFVIDLVYDHNQKGKTIIDWKSGNHSMDDYYQLCIYALYYAHVFNFDINQITVANEYLYPNKELAGAVKYPITKDDIDRVKELIVNSAGLISDFIMSEKLERAEDVLLLPEAPNEKACSWCNFREICHKG
ncbi:PD-(D/E)XK nuclease family protein [Metabacillus schmidteae]|uniref:PD-(D/E)XK nuclease family protein n=1 Tax=Metabacillus schmidteae TaxID=2730405 RepID=UPI00158B095B|nr:PD-(D/E)XK nuclease family protein [Metabacillus schmidteae]